VYTLVSAPIIKAVRTACQLYTVHCVDLWSTLLDDMEQHLQSVRKGVPLSSAERRTMLSGDYFRWGPQSGWQQHAPAGGGVCAGDAIK
jgi:hypothetical protein